MVNSYQNDPVSLSTETNPSGKDVHSFITYDDKGNEIQCSAFYRWKKFGYDIEFEFEIISYPENISPKNVEADARISIEQELRGQFSHCAIIKV